MELMVGTVTLAVFVAVMTAFTRLILGGSTGQVAPLIALMWGIVGGILAYAGHVWPAVSDLSAYLVSGVMAAAAAAGVVSGGKAVTGASAGENA